MDIYTQGFPQNFHHSLKYADIVQTLAKESGVAAAIYYDTNFRQ